MPSPFHGGVRVEDYQLVPLLKALRMPRVSLLLADDVGLGKTVEAGLILTELLLRRRIRRVLVLTPASLRRQWQEEFWEKFSLRFDVVDRRETERLRRRLRADGDAARKREDERYRERQGEVSALVQRSTMAQLSREIERLKNKKLQGRLFDETERLEGIERSIEERGKELKRRRSHYEEIREQLGRERTRILDRLLPARFTLAGEAQVFPVAVEIRLPERSFYGRPESAPA